MAEESVTHMAVRTSFWAAIEKISTMGVQFCISMILARLLSPEDFGVIAILGIFISIGNLFVSCGFISALIRKLDCTQADYSTAFFFNTGMSIIVYLILFVSAPFVADFYNMPTLSPILRIYGITLIINAVCIVQNSILTKQLNFKATAKISALSAMASGILGIIFAYNGAGAWALVAQTISCSIINSFFIGYTIRWKPSLQFSKKSLHYLWGFGSKMLASGLLSAIYQKMYSLFIGKVYDGRSLGLFNRGQSTANIYPEVVQGIFVRNTLPILSKYQNDKERLIYYYRQFCRNIAFLTFPFVCLMVVLAKPFVMVVLTEKWFECIIYIQVFCLAALFIPVNNVNYNILMVVGRSDATLKAELIKKITGIIMILLLVSHGPEILAIGSSCFGVFAYVVNLYYANKYVGISFRDQVVDLVPSLLAAIVSALMVWTIITMIDSFLIQILLGILLQMFFYFFITRYILHLQVYTQLSSIIKRK